LSFLSIHFPRLRYVNRRIDHEPCSMPAARPVKTAYPYGRERRLGLLWRIYICFIIAHFDFLKKGDIPSILSAVDVTIRIVHQIDALHAEVSRKEVHV